MDIVVFGDSHALKFSGQQSFCNIHQIRSVYDPAGFNSDVASKLVNTLQNHSQGICDDFYIKTFQSFGVFGFNSTLGRSRCHTPMDKGIAYAESRPLISPVLMLCATDIDFRGKLLKDIHERRLSSGDKLADIVLSTYSALLNLIDILKNRGCNIIVEGLIPPTHSDELFALLNGYMGSADLRGMVYKRVDTILEHLLDSLACPYISYRKRLATDRGLLKQEYHLDGIHVSTKALSGIIEAIVNRHGQSEQNNSCWQHLGDKRVSKKFDASGSPEIRSLQNSLANDGIAVFTMSDQESTSLALLRNSLDFSEDVGNKHTRYDWPGNSRIPYSMAVKTAKFNQNNLLTAKNLLLKGRLKEFLSSILGFEYSVYNIRAFLSSVHGDSGKGPQSFHHDGTPPYLYRAVIYMSDVEHGDGAFSYIGYTLSDVREGKLLDPRQLQTPKVVAGDSGTIILFDANKILHRGSPPRKKHRYALDLSIGPTPAGSENFIIAGGMNNWPCDPYCFSMKGLSIAYGNDDIIHEPDKSLVFNRYPVLNSYYG